MRKLGFIELLLCLGKVNIIACFHVVGKIFSFCMVLSRLVVK